MSTTPISAPRLRMAVEDALEKLADVFPGRASKRAAALADLYTEALLDCDPDTLPEAVRIVVREDEFFPKPARLRTVSREIASRRRIAFPGAVPGSGAQQGTDTTRLCPQCHTPYVERGAMRRLFCDCQWALHEPHQDDNAAARQQAAIDDARRHRVGGFTPLGDLIADVLPESLPGVPLPAALREPDPPPALPDAVGEPPAWDGPQPWNDDEHVTHSRGAAGRGAGGRDA